MPEHLDSFEKVAAKIAEHDVKFAHQYTATADLMRRVAKLERELNELKSQAE